MSDARNARDLDALGGLVLAAFDAARQKGKPDWRVMSTAVLKNRLLQATGGAFDERDYDLKTIADVVGVLPGIVRPDPDRSGYVTLIASDDSSAEATVRVLGRRARLRRDLWDGIMDYSSGHRWAWSDGVVVPVSDGSSPENVLPTLTPDEMYQLRADFLRSSAATHPLGASDMQALDTWRDTSAGTRALPPSLRGLWNERLKLEAVDRLVHFFGNRGEPLPADLLEETQTGTPRSLEPPRASVRRLLAACVEAMSDTEIAGLQMPVAVILRVLAEHPELAVQSAETRR